MVQLVKRASDVRVSEINLSSIINSNSVTSACVPIISTQGVLHPMHFTNGTDFLAEYGNPDPSISMTIQSALNYFTEGNDLWAIRAVGANYWTSVIFITWASGEGGDQYNMYTYTTQDPLNFEWATAIADQALSNTEVPVCMFYPIHGPGSYSNNLGISVSIVDLTPPEIPGEGGFSYTTNTGNLNSGSKGYCVTAVGPDGESLASNTMSGSSPANSSTVMTWLAVPGAIGYKVYGRSIGGVGFNQTGLLAVVGANTLTFTDDGTLDVDMAVQPPGNYTRSDEFVVTVYDTSNTTAQVLETWKCTLGPKVSSGGVQMQIDDAINPFSSYIQVVNVAPAQLGPNYPAMNSLALQSFVNGDSGDAPTSYDVADALQVFANKQIYGTNVFINAGLSDPIVQLAMDTLVQTRGDAIALLDVPPTQQKFQQAIDYRNLQLNLNSTYSALFNPDVLQADLINGKQVYNPPSGWAGALCARTDRVANQAYSIAGLNRGILNILKTRYQYDDGQSTAMYQAQVNYIRTFVGKGIALWEQQTLSGQSSALSWLSVRRIVNVIKTSLYGFLLYALQEMNSDQVRRQIVNSCSSYLDAIKAAQGLSDFRVVCDDSNNTPTTFNAGVLVVSVVLIPMIPIHEIQLQVIISKSGVSFNEALSAVNGNTQ